MRKMLPVFALLAPFLLAACGADDETVVIQPPQESSTVVVPQSKPDTVVVPQDSEPTVVVPDDDDVDVKVCPEGTVC